MVSLMISASGIRLIDSEATKDWIKVLSAAVNLGTFLFIQVSLEPLSDYNHALYGLPPHTYNDLESLCIYYRLTHDHKYKFPFTEVLSIAINLYPAVLIDYFFLGMA